MSHARSFLAFLIMLSILAGPALARPAPKEDPRDREIRAMKRRLEAQEKQLQDLQETVRQLLERSPAPAASSAPAPEAASAPETATPEPDTAAAANPDESQDPGPEPPEAAPAQSQVGTSGTGSQAAMNPNISVIGLFEGQAGGAPDDPKRDSFFVDEVEIGLQAAIDPSAKLDAFVSFPREGGAEMEEAYATLLTLPYGLQARGGLFRDEFGRLNPVHTHALPQIDRPLPIEQFFGEEGLRSPGVEVSWLAPLPWYVRANLQVTSRFDTPEPDLFTLFPNDGSRKPLYIGRLENLFDLNEDTTLMLGFSGATSQVQDGVVDDSRIGGADLTLKWSPLDNPHQSLVWQSEYLTGQQSSATPDLPDNAFNGWYSFLNYRFNRNWLAGVRYDEADLPLFPGERQRRATALLQFSNSEWNAIRFQFSRYNPNFSVPFNEFRVQWNVVVGPHGAHKY